MTNIHGNPDLTDIHGHPYLAGVGHHSDFGRPPCAALPRHRPPPGRPAFPPYRTRHDSTAIFLLYAAAAAAYALGLAPFFPRTPWHDAAVAAAALPSLYVTGVWPAVKRIPYVGGLLYVLPVLAGDAAFLAGFLSHVRPPVGAAAMKSTAAALLISTCRV